MTEQHGMEKKPKSHISSDVMLLSSKALLPLVSQTKRGADPNCQIDQITINCPLLPPLTVPLAPHAPPTPAAPPRRAPPPRCASPAPRPARSPQHLTSASKPKPTRQTHIGSKGPEGVTAQEDGGESTVSFLTMRRMPISANGTRNH